MKSGVRSQKSQSLTVLLLYFTLRPSHLWPRPRQDTSDGAQGSLLQALPDLSKSLTLEEVSAKLEEEKIKKEERS